MAVRLKRVLSIETNSQNEEQKDVVVELSADAKTDVGGNMVIENMPANYHMILGSYVVTADFHLGQIDSNGTWHWDDEDS